MKINSVSFEIDQQIVNFHTGAGTIWVGQEFPNKLGFIIVILKMFLLHLLFLSFSKYFFIFFKHDENKHLKAKRFFKFLF